MADKPTYEELEQKAAEYKLVETEMLKPEKQHRDFLETLPDMAFQVRVFKPDVTPEEKKKVLSYIEEIKGANENNIDEIVKGVSNQLFPFLDGTVIYANKTALTLLEYPPDKVGNISMAELFAPEHIGIVLENTLRIFWEKRRSDTEYDLMTARGKRLTTSINSNIIGDFPFILQGFARDISERKQSEKDLQASGDTACLPRMYPISSGPWIWTYN